MSSTVNGSVSTSAATSSDKHDEKLIFAPSGSQSDTRADQYTLSTLSRRDLSPSPFDQFHAWFSAARSFPVPLAESVCLSTAHLPTGRVSSRFVYLKELDRKGFVVYSNWSEESEDRKKRGGKARDIRTNPWASMAFWWREMERQVRVEGRTERLTQEESQRYFNTRARGSKIGAWASDQSSILPFRNDPQLSTHTSSQNENPEDERSALNKRVQEIETRFHDTPDAEIPCPPFWGGLRVIPESIEFWQGRESRLHDRFLYSRTSSTLGSSETVTSEKEEGGGGQGEEWIIERLSP